MASEVLSMCTESLPILRSVCIFEARGIYLRKQDASPQIVDPAAVPLVFMLLYVQRLIDYCRSFGVASGDCASRLVSVASLPYVLQGCCFFRKTIAKMKRPRGFWKACYWQKYAYWERTCCAGTS
ncbi:hypothetical protein KL929_003828 [Ogataea haglerorum]|nr:hypothetical protein KL912_000675 [Ogataea haglerorum]KAG7795477.1 hypothetical protein KL929_003828 [Ogataea haglerorum]